MATLLSCLLGLRPGEDEAGPHVMRLNCTCRVREAIYGVSPRGR
jgi:hypothetical protein